MSHRMFLPFCLFLLLFSTPVKASQHVEHLLLRDKDLPYLIGITLHEDQKADITFIPNKLLLPDKKGVLAPLSAATMTETKHQLESFLHIRYDHCIELRLARLGEDSGVQLDKNRIQTSKDIIDYAHQLSKKVGLSTLFHYQSYVKSDMKLKDYYTYYQKLHGKKLHTTYHYLNYLEMEDIALPLDASLHFVKR